MADDSSCLTDASPSAPADTSNTESYSNDTGCNGTVNAAFEDTEGLKNSDGTDSKKGEENNHSTNGELKSPTKDGLPPAEAVNLELVTMSPYTNSIPVKKESTELDMTDPYDEYFVPVNQHKKYIRGEKLYVTQDKRENLAGSKKKCCCGVISVLIVGAAIAILVAVLLTQENGGLTEAEGRNYDKAGFGSNLLPTSRPNSPTSQPPQTTDMSQIYLRNVLEGELTIDNMGFTPGLSNSSSSEFKTLAISLEEEIKKALFEHQELHYGSSDIAVKVIEFRPGSVIVTYRVGWRFKDGIHNPSAPIDMEKLKFNIQKHLKNNDGCLYNYRIPVSSVKANRVIDGCQIDNNGCSNGCVYNSTTLSILCTCPLGFILAEDERNCKEIGIMETHGFDYPHHGFPPMDSSPTPEEPHDDHSWQHEGHLYNSTEPHYHYPTEKSSVHHGSETLPEHEGDSHKSPMEHSHDHENHTGHEHHSDHVDDFNNDQNFSQEEHFNYEHHEHHMEHEKPADNPNESYDRSTASSFPDEPHRELATPDHDHSVILPEEYPIEHHSEISTEEPSHVHPMGSSHEHPMEPSQEHPMEPSYEHPMESSHEHPMESAQEHPVESSHGHPMEPSYEHPIEHSYEHPLESSHHHPMETSPMDSSHKHDSSDDHSMPSVFPVDHFQDDSQTDLDDPVDHERSHEVHLGYLPEPTMIPVPNEKDSSSEDKQPAVLDTSDTEMSKADDKNDNSTDAIGLLPPATVINSTSDSKMSPEYLPEYSTYPDSTNESQMTDNAMKVNVTEPTPIDAHLVEGMNEETSHSKTDDHVSSTETKQIELSSTESSNKQEEEFPVITPEQKEGEHLIPNVFNNNVKENDTREELIDHMPEMGKTESESSSQTPLIPVTDTKEPEKSSKYPEVVNDIHNIDGNPFETERLNELSMSNDSMVERKDHLYSDLHPTEKPIENNVIETFREAKANDFNNSTNNSTTNTTALNDSEGIKPDVLVEVEGTNSSLHSDSVIFVTPPSIEVKNSSDSIESQDTMSKTVLPEMSQEKADENLPKIEVTIDKETVDKVAELPLTERPSEDIINNDKTEHVQLVKSAESETTSDHMIHVLAHNDDKIEASPNPSEESSVNTDKPVDEINPVIFVTQPPVSSTTLPENKSKGSEDEMPMISVPKMPELMGPYPVEENTEIQKEHSDDKTTPATRERPDVYKNLDDESNNLNSLEDDYDNDSLKSKYQKQGKSKLLKNFNVKEIYPHHNNTEKTLDKIYSENEPVRESSSTNPPKIKESSNQLLSDEGYTTLTPLFTSKTEPSSTLSSTTAKIVETTKEMKSDQGLISSEAYTTISPLFRHDSSSQGTTQMKIEEVTTTTPLIFDLIEGKKVDPNTNEFDSSSGNSEPTRDTTDSLKEMNTLPPDTADLLNQTTPPPMEPDVISHEETVTGMPENLKADTEEKKSSEGTESPDSLPIPTTIFPEAMKEQSDKDEMKSNDEVTPTNLPSPSSETTTIKQLETTILPEVSSSVKVENSESSTTDATHADIKDSVVQLLMDSSGLNSTLYSKCASGQWACLDGSGCIAPNSRCDSDKDCLDGSDEANCQEQGCPGNFQCASGECLKRNLVCDSIPHCKDGSDEVDCDSWKCNFDEMQCLPSSRKCIPSLWKCDNIAHCPNNEDEFGCKDSCLNDEFFCPEGWCLPLSKKCDGKTDCAKGEDEINCPA